MHYYKRNLGDYAKKAGRLSMLQHGAYTLLLDACYDRERFPTEAEAIEWTWASTPEEEQAVRFVLSRFFELQDDETYVQLRVNDELQVYKIGEIQNRLIALSREAKRQKRFEFAKDCDQLRAEIKHEPLSKTHAAWTDLVEALIVRDENRHEPPPNQEPLTTNQEPITNNKNIPSENSSGASVENNHDDDSREDSPDKPPPDQPNDQGKKTKASKYKFTDEHYQIAVELSCPVKARFPSQKINLDEWADAIRKLIDIDGYKPEQIHHLWKWIQNHQGNNGFTWADNCRSPLKLRQSKDGLTYFEIIKNQLLREANRHAENQSSGTGTTSRKPSLVERVRANCGEPAGENTPTVRVVNSETLDSYD